jgi:hypothetical protein
MWPWIIAGSAIFIAALGAAVPLARRYRKQEMQRGIREFKLRREMLEARFFDLAKTQGKPRDLRWVECDWLDAVSFARDKQSGLLTAFVAVNIRFEAIEGGDMEGVAAVGTVRDAAAVFHYRDGIWGTGGRALFNMNPEDAIRNLAGQYEPIARDVLTV